MTCVCASPPPAPSGDRAYGSDFRRVGALGSAFISAVQGEGVAACAKHFPGHGDTVQDSHDVVPVIKHSRERLLAREVPPFQAAIASGVASVIVGHLMVPALQDPREVARGIPASMSPSILGLLRNDLAFRGAVMIDDIEMGAIAKRFT